MSEIPEAACVERRWAARGDSGAFGKDRPAAARRVCGARPFLVSTRCDSEWVRCCALDFWLILELRKEKETVFFPRNAHIKPLLVSHQVSRVPVRVRRHRVRKSLVSLSDRECSRTLRAALCHGVYRVHRGERERERDSFERGSERAREGVTEKHRPRSLSRRERKGGRIIYSGKHGHCDRRPAGTIGAISSGEWIYIVQIFFVIPLGERGGLSTMIFSRRAPAMSRA